MAADRSVVGGVVVVIVLLLVAATVYTVVGFLRALIGRAENDLGPSGTCAAQIAAAQASYTQRLNPATGGYYTPCAAANLAVNGVADDPSTTCPRVPPPYAARPPYSVYVSAQCSPPPPAPD